MDPLKVLVEIIKGSDCVLETLAGSLEATLENEAIAKMEIQGKNLILLKLSI